jgi:uncharacterized caspase-like protein
MIARMRAAWGTVFVLLVAMVLLHPTQAQSQDSQPPTTQEQGEKRIALVIGNAAYQSGALPTTANDAGLIAQTLQAAGFDVVGARDLDQDTLRHTFRDFIDKAAQSGPDTVAFIYLAGYGVQLEGQNYFVPVDANLATPASIPSEAVRLSDFLQPLAGLRLKASVIVFDGARANKFAQSDQPLAGGLALMDATPNSLIAFNAAPGTVAPEEQGPYGAYAQALAETMRVGGLPVADVFERTRLRVNEQTQGAMLPWSVSRISEPFVFFDRGEGAPPPQATYYQDKAMQSRKIADFDAGDAYSAALARDTLPAYQEFVTAYPRDPMAKRVRAIIAARREAITWKETWTRDTPNAYWSYLRRYPRGPHAWDARRRLEYLSAALEPPRTFDVIDYDVAPPEEDEVVYVDRPVFVFSDPDFDFAPPPPPPIIFLPPRPRDFVVLAPPPPPRDPYLLPSPPFVAVPNWVRPPRYVRPPPQNFIFDNMHDARIVNDRLANPRRRDFQEGQPQLQPGLLPGGGQGRPSPQMGGAPDDLDVALPPSLRNRQGRRNQPGVPAQNGQPALNGLQPADQGQPGKPGRRLPGQALPGQALPGQAPGQALPGMDGQALPPGTQPGLQPRKGRKPLPGQQPDTALPGGQALPDQNGQGQQQLGPGRKRLQGQQPDNALPSGQALPDQNGQGQQQLRPGRKRLQGQQPDTALPEGQALPDQGGQGQPRQGRKRLQGQQPDNALPGGQISPDQGGQGQQQQLRPGRKRQQGQQPDNALPGGQALPDQGAPALQKPGRKRLPAQQLDNGQDQGGQPQQGNRRQKQQPQFDNAPADNNAPVLPRKQRQQTQPDAAPAMQNQQPRLNKQRQQLDEGGGGGGGGRQQLRQRQQQEAAPPQGDDNGGGGGGRRCGKPGRPPCE